MAFQASDTPAPGGLSTNECDSITSDFPTLQHLLMGTTYVLERIHLAECRGNLIQGIPHP